MNRKNNCLVFNKTIRVGDRVNFLLTNQRHIIHCSPLLILFVVGSKIFFKLWQGDVQHHPLLNTQNHYENKIFLLLFRQVTYIEKSQNFGVFGSHLRGLMANLCYGGVEPPSPASNRVYQSMIGLLKLFFPLIDDHGVGRRCYSRKIHGGDKKVYSVSK